MYIRIVDAVEIEEVASEGETVASNPVVGGAATSTQDRTAWAWSGEARSIL
jgi:hypothetical protein